MEETQLDQVILQIQTGDEINRRNLIQHYKPYIVNLVGHICKKYMTWSDEESSIGLIAFNRAIDTFEAEKGRTFLNYAYLLINRDLINFFHQNKKNNTHSITLNYAADEEGSVAATFEIEKALQFYQEKVESKSLVDEILELDQLLHDFGVGFEELEDVSPKHKDTRKMLNEMSYRFIQDWELVEELTRKKRFPTAAFTKKMGYHLKTIERFRKYIITVIIILLHPEWTHLSSFVLIAIREEELA
jgi:RNA polymerase sigma factor